MSGWELVLMAVTFVLATASCTLGVRSELRARAKGGRSIADAVREVEPGVQGLHSDYQRGEAGLQLLDLTGERDGSALKGGFREID